MDHQVPTHPYYQNIYDTTVTCYDMRDPPLKSQKYIICFILQLSAKSLHSIFIKCTKTSFSGHFGCKYPNLRRIRFFLKNRSSLLFFRWIPPLLRSGKKCSLQFLHDRKSPVLLHFGQKGDKNLTKWYHDTF